MAITWDVKIIPIDVVRKEASITAIRTDSITGKIETHNIITCLLVTVAQKTAVLDQLWSMHLAEVAKQAAITAYIGTLETQAKTNLEARET
jgi:hypothetical protein